MRSFLAFIILAGSSLSAYDLNQLTANMQQRAMDQKITGDVKISADMMERAKNVGYTFDAKKPELEQWKDSMNYDGGKVVFNQQKKAPTKSTGWNGFLSSDERVYIFISSSVPKETLIEYAQTIDALRLGNQIVMVMRGCIGGCEKIKPTLHYINDIITDEGTIKKGMKAQVWIDPFLFRKYAISKAPVVVYAKGVVTEKIQLSEGLDENLRGHPVAFRSDGDWDLEYHLKVLQQKSKSPNLQKLLVAMQKNSFFNSDIKGHK